MVIQQVFLSPPVQPLLVSEVQLFCQPFSLIHTNKKKERKKKGYNWSSFIQRRNIFIHSTINFNTDKYNVKLKSFNCLPHETGSYKLSLFYLNVLYQLFISITQKKKLNRQTNPIVCYFADVKEYLKQSKLQIPTKKRGRRN